MGRVSTSEAVVLKTYDIGDSDRYCIFLTPLYGRINVCAKGVRKTTSKMGSSLQTFQYLNVDLAEHSSGFYLRSAKCLESFENIRKDISKFQSASRGCELIFRLIHESEPSENIFAILKAYLSICNESENEKLFPTLQMMLFRELGLLPSFREDESMSDSLKSYLSFVGSFEQSIENQISDSDLVKLSMVCNEILKDELNYPLKSESVSC
ncbi:DNA repair protein RecO [Candidatus Peribacteria bacterium]|jgi:DNA repair protein RecO (recombination protein O)|nr:DNA repair protein RecO [Candidatus Peribacteria bacterium]MBT4020963.1 DNA repair protein RecO [Candidatus Peribacteria bacterium]MBT4240313.1 DNA repair protein RecO [Candidatus Peribacteria bacterium]MBT4474089.1 DNA repair protein RecO [Candidatus Peribacteria bacterium]